MKLKSKIVASAVLAAIVAGVSSASAATSISLNLVYLGSTANNANAVTKVAQNVGTGSLLNTTSAPGGDLTTIKNGLTQLDLTDPSIQGTVNLKNYFALYVDYVPNLPATDKLYGVGFVVNMPAGMAPVTGNNLGDNTTAKMLFFNPVDDNTGVTTWDTTGDLGDFGGDLQNIAIFQATSASAYAMNIGTPEAVGYDNAGYISGKGTLLGVFALKFTQTNVTGSVSVTGTHGNAAWFTTMDDAAIANDDSAFHYLPGITIGSATPDTPEPASLGVLALGGLALLARRRK